MMVVVVVVVVVVTCLTSGKWEGIRVTWKVAHKNLIM